MPQLMGRLVALTLILSHPEETFYRQTLQLIFDLSVNKKKKFYNDDMRSGAQDQRLFWIPVLILTLPSARLTKELG
jgi:hypothetical protein